MATADITDLSVYSLDVISNGVGSLNPNEYTLSGSATAGDHILIYRVGTATTSANFFKIILVLAFQSLIKLYLRALHGHQEMVMTL